MTMLVELGAIAGLSSVMVVMMLAQPRIFLLDGQRRPAAACSRAIHPRFRTPHITTILTGVGRRAGRRLHADRRPRRSWSASAR